MLKIKQPISLICMKMNRTPFPLGEKIIANYTILSTNFTAKQLLHLLLEPPSVYFANGAPLHRIQYQNKINQWQWNIWNQMVNRIVLGEQGKWHYQDQVYITQALSKIGISNIQSVMKMVQQIKQLDQKLFQQYQSQIHQLRLGQDRREKETIVLQNHEEITKKESSDTKRRYYLQEKVYERLHTEEFAHIMLAFLQEQTVEEPIIQADELQINEQLKTTYLFYNQEQQEDPIVLEMAQLVQQQQKIIEQNRKESQTRKEQFYSKLATSIFLQTIEALFLNRLQRGNITNHAWVQISSVPKQMIQNSIQQVIQEQNNIQLEKQFATQIALEYKSDFTEESYLQQSVQDHWLSVLQSQQELQQTVFNSVQNQRQYEVRYSETDQNKEPEQEQADRVVQIRKQLEKVNSQHEKIMKQQEKIIEKQKQEPYYVPNRAQLKKDLLQSLTAPEAMQRSLSQSIPQSLPGQKLQIDARQEVLLSQMPKETRKFYEMLLTYEQHPEQVDLQQSGVQRGTVAQLQAQLREMDQQQIEMVYQEKAEEVTTKQADQIVQHVWERLETEPNKIEHLIPVEQTIQKKIPMLHKEMTNVLSEELLEQIQQQHTTQQKVEELEVVNQKQSVTTTQWEQIQKEVVAKTQEELETLIQKGLRKQLRTISDQVYQRMETELRNEQRRRGM